MVKKLRYFARYIVVCLLLNYRDQARRHSHTHAHTRTHTHTRTHARTPTRARTHTHRLARKLPFDFLVQMGPGQAVQPRKCMALPCGAMPRRPMRWCGR